MLKKKILSIVTALVLALPVLSIPTYTYAYTVTQEINDFVEIKYVTEITDEFVDRFKQKKQMRIISPWTKNEQERRIIYDNIINIKRLAELKNLSWLDFWTGNITEDNLKYLISNLPNIKSIMFQTNEVIDFGDISNIPGIETLNIKRIQQNIPMVLSTDTFDNPIKFKGEYAEVSPFATITDSNGDPRKFLVLIMAIYQKLK